jgi:hypothetical protein
MAGACAEARGLQLTQAARTRRSCLPSAGRTTARGEDRTLLHEQRDGGVLAEAPFLCRRTDRRVGSKPESGWRHAPRSRLARASTTALGRVISSTGRGSMARGSASSAFSDRWFARDLRPDGHRASCPSTRDLRIPLEGPLRGAGSPTRHIAVATSRSEGRPSERLQCGPSNIAARPATLECIASAPHWKRLPSAPRRFQCGQQGHLYGGPGHRPSAQTARRALGRSIPLKRRSCAEACPRAWQGRSIDRTDAECCDATRPPRPGSLS